MPLDLPFPFTLPRLFRSPAISNFFHFPWDFEIAGFDCNLIYGFTYKKTHILNITFWVWSKSFAVASVKTYINEPGKLISNAKVIAFKDISGQSPPPWTNRLSRWSWNLSGLVVTIAGPTSVEREAKIWTGPKQFFIYSFMINNTVNWFIVPSLKSITVSNHNTSLTFRKHSFHATNLW